MTTYIQPDEKIIAQLKPGCICKGIKLVILIEAIENGADSFEEIARKTGIGGGSCNGRRCGKKIADLLNKYTNTDI